ncbi:MAG: SRPBCC family protein [Chloroflexi bacterium]|nr:SRPBCC family protein [Chloroflexota bacterium]
MPRIEERIHVDAPIDQVYRFWTNFESFPRFMENVDQVKMTGPKTLHWKAHIAGTPVEWDAEITELKPSEKVAWRSTTGTGNSGEVTFARADTGTDVHVILEYTPPAGAVGATLDQFARATERNVEEDLQNFRRMVER